MRKIISICLLVIAFSGNAQKVTAYFTDWKTNDDVDKIQWTKLTDIVYGFCVPTTTGTISVNNAPLLTYLISQAEPKGVKVHISCGGAGASGNFSSVAISSTNRNNFAASAVDLVNQYGLDGFDIDWEFPSSAQTWQFEQLLSSVNTALNTNDPTTELSIAVAPVNWNSDGVTLTATSHVDYIHLMAYDNGATNHSTLTFAQQSITFWSGKGVSKSKMNLGVPFYGKDEWQGGSSQAYSELSAPNVTLASQTDSYNGWGYNGQPTMKAKANKVISEGLNGIMIWELSQDRDDEYSLLNAIDEVLDAGTICEDPILGLRKNLCVSPTIVLDPNVSSGSGFNFEWTKTGSAAIIGTSSTMSISEAGSYCVEYTHTTGNCPVKTTCVEVVNAELIEVQDGSICSPGTVDFEVLTIGAIKWYDAEVNGNHVESGQSYTTPIISTDKTYWVEKPAVSDVVAREYSDLVVGPKGWSAANSDDRTNGAYRALSFNAISDYTLDYITVYTETAGSIKFTIKNSSDGVVATSTNTVVFGKNRVNVNMDIVAGTNYRFEVDGTLWIETDMSGTPEIYGTTTSGVATFNHMHSKDGWGTTTEHYIAIYDWEISSGGSCGSRTAVEATIESNCPPPVISNLSLSEGEIFNGAQDITFTTDITDADGIVETVSFEIYEVGNTSPIATLTPAKSGDTYSSSHTTTIGSYIFKVIALDNDANSTTDETNFSVSSNVGFVDNFQELGFQLYPNPSQGNFNLDMGNKSGVELNIYDAQGTLIEKINNGSGLITIGENYKTGVYIIQLNDNGILASEKIMKN